MLKFFLGLVLGLAGGGAGSYYYTTTTNAVKVKALEAEKRLADQELASCNEQKSAVEENYKKADAEIKLNEDRACFVTGASLPAPEFEPADLDVIHSDSAGDIVLNWKPIKGAKKYIVKVESEDGTVINTTDVEGEPTMYLNRISSASKLDAAQYFVRITAVNGFDQEGAPSERKPIQFASQTLKSKTVKKSQSHKIKTKKR